MIEARYEFRGSDGAVGQLVVRGGLWAGDECVFEFTETLRGVSGVVRCDWRKDAPDIEVHVGITDTVDSAALIAQLAELMRPFFAGAFADVSRSELRSLYAGDYHHSQNYANNHPYETAYKKRIVDALLSILGPRKVLDAGCSAGEVVRQLRERGVDAWGFDLCSDLDVIGYPEVRDNLRQGKVTGIPFGPEDGFDTLVALDVFEHIPEADVPAMIDEFARLGVKRVVALIALCEFQCAGHITLRPLHWWDRRFAPRFRRCREGEVMGAMARAFETSVDKYLAVYDLVESELAPASCVAGLAVHPAPR